VGVSQGREGKNRDPHRQESAGIKGPHLFRYYNPRPSKVEAAEKAFAEYIGVKHCLAVNSCTSALVAAMKAVGVGMGDEVIVPAYTFSPPPPPSAPPTRSR